MPKLIRYVLITTLALGLALGPLTAEDDPEVAKLRKKLEDAADVEQKVMVPMRDGVHLATDVYRPKGAEGPLPTIFWRTPYNFNKLGKSRLELLNRAMESGYALIIQNERGKFFSEGEWEILGFPRTDGYDALKASGWWRTTRCTIRPSIRRR